MQSLGDALPAEMARVRDHVMPLYQEIGVAGLPGLMLMRASLDRAAKALASGDVAEMIRAYEDLKEFKG